MKYLLFILFSAVTLAQTYDVGQDNAPTAQALVNALAQPDSNSTYRTELNSKAPKASPTFSGTVTLPSTTSIGTVSNTEIGYLDNVTSAIQTQLNAKQALDADLTTIAGLTATTDNFLVSVSSAWASRTPAQVRTTLGLVIGTNVQAYDADLTSWGAITPAIYYDTLSMSIGVMDTVTTGDYPGVKIPNNITITEVAAYTNTGTVTFNLEERAQTTPNTAGTDVMTSDLVADTDQQETGTFSNADLDRDDWLVMSVTSVSGDPTIFSVTIRYIKTN